MKKNKYTIIYEGKTEGQIFNYIKTEILKIKTLSICNKHKNLKTGNIKGTIKINDIKKAMEQTKNCCNLIVLMDKDDFSNSQIDQYIKLNNDNTKIIVSNPCIEIILYVFFYEIPKYDITKNDIEKKLNEKCKLYNINYKHGNTEVITKIMEQIKNNYEVWFNKLKELKEDNKNNFFDLIKFLKKYK